ncbi:MAG: prepilin peptidase [Bacillota bacterium]
MTQAPSVLVAITVTWAALAAIWDLRTQRIPNWMTFPAALLGVAINVALGGVLGFGQSALGILLGLALLIIPFAMGGMGAGDVKMLATVGAFGGPAFVWRTFLMGSIAGGLISIGFIISRSRVDRRSLEAAVATGRVPGGVVKASKQAFPYGVAILAGTIAASFLGWSA